MSVRLDGAPYGLEGVRLGGTVVHPAVRVADTPFLQPPVPVAPSTGGRTYVVPRQPVPPAGLLGRAPGGSDVVMSGEALFATVAAPVGAGGLPVVVWVVGGGFAMCWPMAPLADLAATAEREQVVVVAVTYRVGFDGGAELRQRGGEWSQAGNLALRDVVTGLAWVHEHVAAFGGEPDDVTVLGHSAGAFLAAAALASPGCPPVRRSGLFSGGASRLVPLDRAAETTDEVLHALGVGVDGLSAVAPERLTEAAAAVIPTDLGARNGPRPHSWGVVLDGAIGDDALLPQHPMDVLTGARIPLLLSATRSEARMWVLRGLSVPAERVADLVAELERFGAPPDTAASLVDEALTASGGDLAEARSRLLSEYVYQLPAARLATARAGSGLPTTLVWVDDEEPGDAVHGCEVTALLSPGAAGARGDAWARVVWDVVHDRRTSPGLETGSGASADDLVRRWAGVPRP